MTETGVTYRGLADKTKLSAGYLNHLVHGNRPVPSDKVVGQLAKALGVEPEHFREYRLRVITERLEEMPEEIDRLYKRLERDERDAELRIAGVSSLFGELDDARHLLNDLAGGEATASAVSPRNSPPSRR